jgi:hypothetical protein
MNPSPTVAPDTGLFKPGNLLLHKKSGGVYKVIVLANMEVNLAPVYVYESMQTHDFWIRPQAEMEDGRFALVARATGGMA